MLFVKDVRELFCRLPSYRSDAFAEMLEMRRLKARAIRFAFQIAAANLAEDFEVRIAADVVEGDPSDPEGPALRIVDTMRRERETVVEDFEALNSIGWDLDAVWEALDGFDNVALNQKIVAERVHNECGEPGMTRDEMRKLHATMAKAVTLGIYVPKKPQAKGRQRRARVHPPRAATPSRSGIGPTALYDGLRRAPLPPETAQEFGVRDVMDLVMKLNARWLEKGHHPLPQGSFPTNKQTLAAFLKVFRAETAHA